MRGRAQPLDIGPFTGGLNLAGDPYGIADTELVELTNLNVASDGSLYTRPPIYNVPQPPGAAIDYRVLLRVQTSDAIFRLLVSSSQGLYMYNVDTGAYTLLRENTFAPGQNPWTAAILTNGWLYVSGTDKGRMNVAVNYNWVADTSIPMTTCFVIHRSRIFAIDITADSRIEYSNLITPASGGLATWSKSTNWFDVSPGDSDMLLYMMPYNNDLLLFKQNKTYLFLYDLDIQAEGTLRLLSSVIGGSIQVANLAELNINIKPAVAYQNSVFVMHEAKLYEMAGYNFIEVNPQLEFPSVPYAINVFDDYVILSFAAFMYAYHVPSKTWSKWESGRMFGSLVSAMRSDGRVTYYAGDLFNFKVNFFAISPDDLFATAASEPITVSFRTKTFDFSDAFHYKKLMWWLLSFVTPNPTQQGTITVSAHTEDPYSTPVAVYDSITPSVSTSQTVARFLKTLRFKRIYFRVEQSSPAVSSGNRTRFFGLGAAVSQKQTLSQKGN